MSLGPDPNLFRSLEAERLRALVNADIETADRLHAADFQLVTPSDRLYTKDQSLGEIASGELDYLVFAPETEIQVRVAGPSAAIR